ncbi:bacillithiol biosynthesis cysteine-adding enzyme BshC [Caldalkalibacillus thermarum TA2.A1]|uniref:Putative cysteine ligase BshC n=1 Tax=Caldalkalibacillus thermarum (strain TA2.A1) TaxID=986075 RepID=A0A8X8L9J1_CALTT|nr:bacillithiol biosynthesis cysteine-adding enzyme BshC [Caldalkalibacillus thermarum]QZT33123.1 bacillithiol biosynthesis cysteine-adding enzyme BshC [Caldalkalibacillus thermarum TA2.A1]
MELKIKEYDLPQINTFATDYVNQQVQALQFFHYDPFDKDSYKRRWRELRERTFARGPLAEVIRAQMARWTLSPAQEEQLQRLQQEESVVVLGGQQAGLLTGPMYTLYKAVTILKVARTQEEQLGVPVVPVFWIAGEDHDFQEINHVFVPRAKGAGMEKLSLSDPHGQVRQSIDHRPFPRREILSWLENVFEQWPQTEFTEEVRHLVLDTLHKADTYTAFFAGLMHQLFTQYGLLLVNSADPALRRLESSVFETILTHYDLIDGHVRQQIKRMEEQGYTPQITLGEHPALLFIYENKERLLLEKKGAQFQTKNGQSVYSEAELLDLAKNEPWQFSNNVITRPFMQESLFPTLTFVAGSGEIAYWALYGTYFEAFNMRLPVIMPRLNLTLVEPNICHLLEKHNIDIQTVFGSFEAFREQWLAEQDELGLEQSFAQVKQEVVRLYQPLLEKVCRINKGMEQLGRKNLDKVLEQVDYFHKRAMAAFKTQHEAAIRHFDKVEQALYPEGRLQERVYYPFHFFNKHGFQLLEVLMQQSFCFNGKHKLVYLHVE